MINICVVPTAHIVLLEDAVLPPSIPRENLLLHLTFVVVPWKLLLGYGGIDVGREEPIEPRYDRTLNALLFGHLLVHPSFSCHCPAKTWLCYLNAELLGQGIIGLAGRGYNTCTINKTCSATAQK